MAATVHILEWDSAFWGLPAARVDADDPADLAPAIASCADSGVAWATLRVPTHRLDLFHGAIAEGFELVDIRCELHRPLSASDAEGLSPRLADESHVPELERVARSAITESRFFADPHLDDSRCHQFYATWLRNSFETPLADAVILGEDAEGRPAGFATVAVGGDAQAQVGLVAVDPRSEGLGIGRQMINHAISWAAAAGCGGLSVATQLHNPRAIRLYESTGFRTVASSLTLHRWNHATASVPAAPRIA